MQEMARKMHDLAARRWHHQGYAENGKGAAVSGGEDPLPQRVTEYPRTNIGQDVSIQPGARRRMGREGSDVLYRKACDRTGSPPGSPWWLITKNGRDHFEVFTLDDGCTLPVFSGEGEAEMYLWCEGACGRGWATRRSTPWEVMSMLDGPCSDAGAVALDPSPRFIDGRPTSLVNLDRSRFVEWMVSREGRLS
jgi:hypothetical protein